MASFQVVKKINFKLNYNGNMLTMWKLIFLIYIIQRNMNNTLVILLLKFPTLNLAFIVSHSAVS